MKTVGILVLLLLVGAGSYFLGIISTRDHATGGAAPTEKTLYTCGMHPNVIQDKPGNCPICGMKLTPIRKTGGAAPAGEGEIAYYKSTMIPGETSPAPGKDSMGMEMVPVYESEASMDAAISIDPVTVQNMGLRTAVATNGPLRRTVRTVATIDYDETTLTDVTTKFKGWIEKLYVDATGALVHQGDPLFEIYSPDLYSAQTEYLLALEAAPGNSYPGADALRESARTKLEFWDISEAQIERLKRTGKPAKTLKITAPIDGFVVEKTAVEGRMVDAGMKLYRLTDLNMVWVYAPVYEQDLPFVHLGQEAVVTLSYLPDRKFRGRVTYIYPTLDSATRTARVRMEFHNPGYFLKPGMFATVELSSQVARSALLVPDMAVLRSGERNTVFVARDSGKFEPRAVKLGMRAGDGLIQVLSGLRAGDRVVTSGQFMLDSESQLREAIQKMLEPNGVRLGQREAEPIEAGGQSARESDAAQEPPKATYICPMPEHVAIEYDQPGDCPLCGMSLVPVSKELLAKIQPGGTVDYYTCPMPEHADVKLDRPGKCPRCRMTLIPVMPKPSQPEPPAASPLAPLYTCPMHPAVRLPQPGKCPICNMKLVPVEKADDHAKPGSADADAATPPL